MRLAEGEGNEQRACAHPLVVTVSNWRDGRVGVCAGPSRYTGVSGRREEVFEIAALDEKRRLAWKATARRAGMEPGKRLGMATLGASAGSRPGLVNRDFDLDPGG